MPQSTSPPGISPKLLRNGGWSIVSSRPAPAFGTVDAANSSCWSRTEIVAPYALVAVKGVFFGWQSISGSGELGLYNDVRIQCAFRKQGAAINRGYTDPGVRAPFKGDLVAWLSSSQKLETDPTYLNIAASERFFAETYLDANIGAGPSAPTLTATTGGSLGAATYYVSVCYVYPNGGRSLMSTVGSCVVSGGNNAVNVTAPAAVAGAIGYRVYFSATSSGSILYEASNFAVIPLGTDFKVAAVTNTSSGAPAGGNSSQAYGIVRSGNQGIFTNGGVGGYTDAGSNNSGEAYVAGRDYLSVPYSSNGSNGVSAVAPNLVLGMASDGQYHPSVIVIGDSIAAGTGDKGFGYAGTGGFLGRALMGQTGLYYALGQTPTVGWATLACGGETQAQFANFNTGGKRWSVLGYATSVIDEYGANDIYNAVTGAAGWYVNAQTIYNICAGLKVWYFRTTIIPFVASSDGYQTVANQSIPSSGHTVAEEALRRQVNNLIVTSTGAVAVSAETPFRAQSTATPSTNFFSGGDGTTTAFYPSYPFLQGSETVVVNGATLVQGAGAGKYTYINTTTVNGQSYADGVLCGTAPGNAQTVTIAYTKLPSCPSFGAYWGGYFDSATQIEVNAAGAQTRNGGWLKAGTASSDSGTFSSVSNSSRVNDTTKTWTQDQWRGYSIYITGGTGAGQSSCIQYNTATSITCLAFTTLPDATSTYILYKSVNCGDAVHPSSYGHQLMAQGIDVSVLL